MRIISAATLSAIDHHDVKEISGKTEADRRKYRLRIIKNFMTWAKTQDDETFNHEVGGSTNREVSGNVLTEKNILLK